MVSENHQDEFVVFFSRHGDPDECDFLLSFVEGTSQVGERSHDKSGHALHKMPQKEAETLILKTENHNTTFDILLAYMNIWHTILFSILV